MSTKARDEALEVIFQYGAIDGAHHKQWVLDQVVRKLLTPEEYDLWVLDYNGPPDSCGDTEYVWEEGVAP